MPTYEYLCRDCDTSLEVVQSIHDDSLRECPSCAGSLRKVYGNVGVVFKGSGFYRTDSRSKSSSRTPAAKDKGASDPAKLAGADKAGAQGKAGSDKRQGSDPKAVERTVSAGSTAKADKVAAPTS